LRIYGEQEFPVRRCAEFAIELFVQRASAIWPDFCNYSENAPAVQEVCSRLDGLPWRLSWRLPNQGTVAQRHLDRLQSRLQLLTGGALDLPERQQTLRKTIDWSPVS